MTGIPKSLGGWLSTIGLALGAAFIIACIWKSVLSRSDRYWPLLAIGFPLVCIAGPFYQYYKSRDDAAQPYRDAGIEALAAAGRAMQKEKEERATTVNEPKNPKN